MVANVTYVNGVETERTILSSVTLKEPVTAAAPGHEGAAHLAAHRHVPVAHQRPDHLPLRRTVLPAASAPPTIRASILPGRTARRSTRRTAAQSPTPAGWAATATWWRSTTATAM
ncbi:MAG: G5 domain-containing protein [Dysosmobacter welbionis]